MFKGKEVNNNLEITNLLYQQLDNFTTLDGFVKSRNITPATVFLPQTINLISENVTDSFIIDCINFLDVIKFYSALLYGDEEHFINIIKNIIISNRISLNEKYILNRDLIDDYLFKSKEDTNDFLETNKIILAVYICSLLNFILFSF